MTAMIPQQKRMAGQTQQCMRLASVLTITKTMLACAELGEWDKVAECERERREDLALCFSDTLPAADTELVAEAMAALLHLNEELMALLQVARTEVMDEGRAFSRQRSAVGNYREMEAAR